MTEAGFEECFREHFPRLVALGETMSGDSAVAHELALESFVRLHTRWETVSSYEHPEGWLRRVAPGEIVRQYGSADDGFTVTGSPVGLAESEIPLSDFIGPTGQLVVNKRFTGERLDSQINITRSSRVDVSALVAEFEIAAAEGAAETTKVFVGEDNQPGLLYRDALSDWYGLMWPVSETSVFYVLAQGLSEDEILEVAGSVGVVQ